MIGFSNDDPFGIKKHRLLWIKTMARAINTDIQVGDVVYFWRGYEILSAKAIAVGDLEAVMNGRKLIRGNIPQELWRLPHVEIEKNGITEIELRFKVFKDFSLAREMFFKTCPSASGLENDNNQNKMITNAIIKFENDNAAKSC